MLLCVQGHNHCTLGLRLVHLASRPLPNGYTQNVSASNSLSQILLGCDYIHSFEMFNDHLILSLCIEVVNLYLLSDQLTMETEVCWFVSVCSWVSWFHLGSYYIIKNYSRAKYRIMGSFHWVNKFTVIRENKNSHKFLLAVKILPHRHVDSGVTGYCTVAGEWHISRSSIREVCFSCTCQLQDWLMPCISIAEMIEGLHSVMFCSLI